MLRILFIAYLIPLSIQQLTSSCTTCNGPTNADYSTTSSPPSLKSTDQYISPRYSAYSSSFASSLNNNNKINKNNNNNGIPGLLPNYQGDRFTSRSRRDETLRLNRLFFDSIQNNSSSLPAPPSRPVVHSFGKSSKSLLPIVFTGDVDISTMRDDEPLFLEIHDEEAIIDDVENSTRADIERETSAQKSMSHKDSPQFDYVKFNIQPNGKLADDGSMLYESEATRAIIEALHKHDSEYIQRHFQVDFVPK